MIMRRFDRYILREMIGPFLVSVGGLFLFILLNLILSLSGLLVDRGVGFSVMLRLLVLKTPTMLVLALPVSGLFATFLGLGRLVHDREIMALEASGIPLRRILLPLVIAALFLGIGDFGLYNWAVPPAERAYQATLRGIIFREGAPHIRANTFFRGPEGEFFYVRRYDESDRTLHEVLIYDTQRKLFPTANAAVTILTAREGKWDKEAWDLKDGRVYGYDSDGVLIYTGKFDHFRIAVGSAGIGALVSSRTPAEMGINELRERIALLRRSGLSADELIVECNLKLAIPLAAVVFVLFGGATSLLFAWRSRAVGIVIGFLLVGGFQGTLLWTQTLGRRGIISPALAAWIPDLAFGVIGIFLFLRLDRLHSGNARRWVRRFLPFLFVFLLAGTAFGATPPVAIDCDRLFISSDEAHVEANGNVHLSYEKTVLSADRVRLDREEDGSWSMSATGAVSLRVGDGLELTGDEVSARLVPDGGGLTTGEASAGSFQGKSKFKNSKGEEHLLIYRGKEGRIAFDANGEVDEIEITDGELSTCDCCGGLLRAQPYSIETGRLILYPNRLIVAFNLSVRTFGTRVFWLPVYVQPLKETLESPLFPAVGESALHGFFLKWNLPFYFDRENYGAILFDYFSRFQEVGLGAVVHYALAGLSGRARVYFFPAKVGDSVTEVSLAPRLSLPGGGEAAGSVSYKAVGKTTSLSFSAAFTQALGEWDLSLAASRKTTEVDGTTRTVERLPELDLSRGDIQLGPLSVGARLSAGWYKEWRGDASAEAMKIETSVSGKPAAPLRFSIFSLSPRIGIDLSRYATGEGRESGTLAADLSAPGLKLSYTYRLVHGSSPFEFDRVETTDHLTWSLGGTGLAVAGGLDLAGSRFDPMRITTSFPPFSLRLDYDLNRATATKLIISGAWKGEGKSASFSLPYLPETGKFGKASFTVAAAAGNGSLSLKGTISPDRGIAADLKAEMEAESGWGLILSSGYRAGKIANPGFGVFYEFYHCLRVGVERRAGQFWLYTSITAFPEAVLRYAPAGAEVKLGE